MLTSLFTSIALALPLNDSLDPWGRPTHARVIIEPPSELADLYAAERRFRFWWDDVGLTATIEIRGKLRWKTLATDVPLGWISDELPRGSVFRIRLEGGTRTSSPLSQISFMVLPTWQDWPTPMRCSHPSSWTWIRMITPTNPLIYGEPHTLAD